MTDLERVQELWKIEKEKIEQGYSTVVGVDEAGRGPLAGPVCVAAVILPYGFYLEDIDDSKKLTEKKKNRLYDEICKNAIAYNIVLIHNNIIDEMNILNATFKGMCDAVAGLVVRPDFVLIDGNAIKGMETPHQCVTKGDSKSISIAAASVLAKVTRDRYMIDLNEKYPQYHFSKHKGYPTKLHYELLKKSTKSGAQKKL